MACVFPSPFGGVRGGYPEILCQIDNLDVLGDGMFLQELLTLSVSEAEEYNINLIEGHLVGEAHIGLANETFMDVADQVASVTL